MQSRWNPLVFAIHRKRYCYRHTSRLLTVLIAFSLALVSPLVVKAQGPSSFWIAPYQPEGSASSSEESAEAATARPDVELVVDTDSGVDDATALAWLLSQPQVKIYGIVTVAGNATVENATKNVLTVLKQMGDPDVRVVMGASKPLQQRLSSVGMLIHGKDGLWGLQDPNVSTSSVSKDPRLFYCTTALRHPGTAILALGPDTNLAQAIRLCPSAMKRYSRIYVLGGAKFGGNTKPDSEFNFWQDPEAAQILLKSGLTIHMIPLDGFSQLTFDPADLGAVSAATRPIMQFLAPALGVYMGSQFASSLTPIANIPDLVAAMYAVEGLGTATSGLVQVVDSPDILRGKSVIGLAPTEKITMIAGDRELDKIAQDAFPPGSNFPDPSFVQAKIGEILSRVPDNANVVMDIKQKRMHKEFIDFLNVQPATTSDVQPGPNSEHIYIPSIIGH